MSHRCGVMALFLRDFCYGYYKVAFRMKSQQCQACRSSHACRIINVLTNEQLDSYFCLITRQSFLYICPAAQPSLQPTLLTSRDHLLRWPFAFSCSAPRTDYIQTQECQSEQVQSQIGKEPRQPRKNWEQCLVSNQGPLGGFQTEHLFWIIRRNYI